MSQSDAIGIDVGASHFRVAVYRGNKFERIEGDMMEVQTPCYARLDTDDEWTVGEPAKLSASRESSSTVFFVKRLLKVEVENCEHLPFNITALTPRMIQLKESSTGKDQTILPIVIYSEFLCKAREIAEMFLRQNSIEFAVLTVPDTFDEVERKAIQSAATLAGLNVLCINDTAAAAKYYATQMESGAKKSILIFDLGEDSLKISAWDVEKNEDKRVRNWKPSKTKGALFGKATKIQIGGEKYGGFDFDVAIVDHVYSKVPELKKAVETEKGHMWHLLSVCKNAREQLISAEKTIIDLSWFDGRSLYFTRTDFNNLARVEKLVSLFETKIKETIEQCKCKGKDISEIVSMGGASNMECIQILIKTVCNESNYIKINRMLDGYETIAFGAAAVAYETRLDPQIHHFGHNVRLTADLANLKVKMETRRTTREKEHSRHDSMNHLVTMLLEIEEMVKKLKNRDNFAEKCKEYITWEKNNPNASESDITNYLKHAEVLKEDVKRQQEKEHTEGACGNISCEAKVTETTKQSDDNCSLMKANVLEEVDNNQNAPKMREHNKGMTIKLCNYHRKKNDKIPVEIKLENNDISLNLKIFPNGYGNNEGAQMSVAIEVLSCPYSQTRCIVSLLNPMEDANHKDYVVTVKNHGGEISQASFDNDAVSSYIEKKDDSIYLRFKLENPSWLYAEYTV